MRTVFTFALVFAVFGHMWAQSESVYLAGQRLPMQVTVFPVYEQFTVNNFEISEISAPLSLYLPLHRNLGVYVRSGAAQIRGESLESVIGLADTQIDLSWYIPVGQASLLFNIGTNAPSGKTQLATDEFVTLALASQNLFNFQTPAFGQGLGLSPGLSIAIPVSGSMVVGFGAAYNYHGAFEPLANMETTYEPGDELLFTAGLDYHPNLRLTLSVDASYTIYQADALGETEVYQAGNKLVTSAQLLYTFGFHKIQLLGRYRNRAKNSVAVAGGELLEEEIKTLPDQLEGFGQMRFRLGRRFYAGLLGEYRWFGDHPSFPDISVVYGAGLALEIPVSRKAYVPLRFLYQLGDLEGFEVGAGLSIIL